MSLRLLLAKAIAFFSSAVEAPSFAVFQTFLEVLCAGATGEEIEELSRRLRLDGVEQIRHAADDVVDSGIVECVNDRLDQRLTRTRTAKSE